MENNPREAAARDRGMFIRRYGSCLFLPDRNHLESNTSVYNVGYNIIEDAFSSHVGLTMALSLLLLKMLATSLTLGSGGVFAPSLFMGAMLGAAFSS